MLLLREHPIDQKIYIYVQDVAGSFSAVAGVERVTKIASGRLVSFSEQQLLDCDREYTTKAVTVG